MSMPEATVYEDGYTPSRKHQVRLSWQIIAMNPEPETDRVRGTPNC
jgi:hypothetical protein